MTSLGSSLGAIEATHVVPVEPFATTFTFDWEKAPLSLNYRLNRYAEAKIVKEIRSLMQELAFNIPFLGQCHVSLVWVVKTRGKRDDENIVPVLKALCDGLVDAGVVEDDTRQFMKKDMPEIRYEKGATAHFEFTVKEVRE